LMLSPNREEVLVPLMARLIQFIGLAFQKRQANN
jgi:hypothetical protein